MKFVSIIFIICALFVVFLIGRDVISNISLLESDRETAVKGLKYDAAYFIGAVILGTFLFLKLNDSIFTFG